TRKRSEMSRIHRLSPQRLPAGSRTTRQRPPERTQGTPRTAEKRTRRRMNRLNRKTASMGQIRGQRPGKMTEGSRTALSFRRVQ
ncbi:MAG: hypothetical protein K1W22_02930, partial [Lachnospiraceae bacterium]